MNEEELTMLNDEEYDEVIKLKNYRRSLVKNNNDIYYEELIEYVQIQ